MYKLSMAQVIAMTCTSFLPLLLWVFPRYAAYFGGVDGQWAVLGVCIIGAFIALVHGLLNQQMPKISGAEMPTVVFGKYIGRTTSLLFVPGYILFAAISLFSFSVTLKSLLPNTPSIATMIGLVLIAMMGANYGLETLARVVSIVFPITIIVLFSSFLFIFHQGTWTGVFVHPVSVTHSAVVAAQLLPMFFGLNLYLMLSPHYDRRKGNAVWLILFAVGISSITIIFLYFSTMRVVGYEGLRVLVHPIEFVLQLVQLHGLVIQRFGIVLVFVLTMFETVFFANHLWSIAALTSHTFRLQQSSEKWFILFYSATIVVIAQCVPNQQSWDFIVQNILVPLSWLYLVIEPTTKLIVSYFRADRIRAAQESSQT